PHATAAELLCHLGQHRHLLPVDVHGELDRHVDLGERAAGELDVDHRPGDPDDASFLQGGGGFGHGHGQTPWGSSSSRMKPGLSSPRLVPSASAPPTISMISVVMESCRARFMTRDRVLISSSALSVAAFMARWRNACSDAAALSSAA